jgi:diketogulonate reductase-like aldo/keto reductase
VRLRRLGTTEARIPAIGQGTWKLELADRRAAIAALARGIELGMTHVDTAEMYGSGEVEGIVGAALRTIGPEARERVFLASKVLPHNASRAGTITACERSLERLGTDWLDLYLLHWPGEHPLGGTIEAFEELVRRGLVRHWGVSNFDAHELDEVVRIAGPGRCACDQVLYHLEERAIEHRVLPKCEELGMTLVAYSPFAEGRFPAPDSRGGRALAEVARPRRVAAPGGARLPHAPAVPGGDPDELARRARRGERRRGRARARAGRGRGARRRVPARSIARAAHALVDRALSRSLAWGGGE